MMFKTAMLLVATCAGGAYGAQDYDYQEPADTLVKRGWGKAESICEDVANSVWVPDKGCFSDK